MWLVNLEGSILPLAHPPYSCRLGGGDYPLFVVLIPAT